jgi:hypothetical protein
LRRAKANEPRMLATPAGMGRRVLLLGRAGFPAERLLVDVRIGA